MRAVIRNLLGVRLAGGGASFVGAYDAIPSIAAAYGMRRLRSAYTGNLLRLRRSSDNTEQDFGYTSTGALEAAAIATFVGGGNGFVVTWYDQSGNGNNATQSTAASQPQYDSPANGLTFDGTNDHLVTTVLGVLNKSYIARFANYTAGIVLGSRVSGLNGIYIIPNDGANVHRFVAGAAVDVSPALTSGVIGISNKQGYLNGATNGAAIGAGAVTGVALHIGGLNTNGTPGNYVACKIQEVIFGDIAYDGTQMASIATIMG